MTTTDSGLRIEYFKDNLYGRVYAVPSAHPQLDWTAAGGYPYLGYLIRFGRWTIYHAGDCAMYPELAAHLRPFNVNVALLPIGPGNFSVSEAAQLASDIGAAWIVPMHYGGFVTPDEGDIEAEFVSHMLGHRPEQRFKVFQCGEKWTVPEE
jgi:L-ascorbate metabolism protein UlaG (beta-lactamase superfamily)